MKATDQARFDQKISLSEAADAEAHLERCAGLDIPELRDLEREILGDLDLQNLGVSWWAPHLDPKRRIVIGDYLYAVTTAVRLNLTDARLHLLEAEGAWEQHSKRIARIMGPDRSIAYPPTTSAADALCDRLASLHVAGVFRALGSALDCLAGVTIGVLALPMPIIRADFSGVRQFLLGTAKKHQLVPLQTEFGSDLERWIASAGPVGWIDWALEYRNALVHRARRVEPFYVEFEAHVLDSLGRPIPKAVPTPVLLREPGLSDVEALLDGNLFLPEDGARLLHSVVESAEYLIKNACGAMRDAWQQRRANPTALLQPQRQWPVVPQRSVKTFAGYSTRKLVLSHDKILTGAPWGKRLGAAALTDAKRGAWKAFPP